MSDLTPYQYLHHSGQIREVSASEIADECTGDSDMDREAMAALARRLHRQHGLRRAMRVMCDAGERMQMLAIVRHELGDDIRCL